MTAPPHRVLHVLEATLGGTRRYLEDIAVATAGLPFAQGLVYGTSRADPGFSELLDVTRRSGWFLVPVDALRRAVHPTDDSLSMLAIRRAIRAFAPSVVHVHSAKAGAVGRVAALACWPASPPVVYSPHALPARLGKAYMIAERALAPFTKSFVAVSDSERSEIIAEGIAAAHRVSVVYPRIDADAYAPRDQPAARAELSLPQGVPIVIGIGRLAAQKDPVGFVRSLALVRGRHPDLIGLWIGDGELRAEVEKLATELNLGRGFRVMGWQTDVRPFIAAGDILLSTSQYESFGYVIPETFSMERAVVASRVTGTIDVVYPAARGMLFAPNQVTEAADLIAKLITDKELRTHLGRLGRLSVIEKFSTAAMRAALTTVYDAALS